MYSLFLRLMVSSILLIMINSTSSAQVQVHDDYEQMDTIRKPFETQPWYHLKGKQKEYPKPDILFSTRNDIIQVKIEDAVHPKDGDLIVKACIEDENTGITSPVNCDVKGDTIACSW